MTLISGGRARADCNLIQLPVLAITVRNAPGLLSVEPAAVPAPEPPQQATVAEHLIAADGRGVEVDVVVGGDGEFHSSQ